MGSMVLGGLDVVGDDMDGDDMDGDMVLGAGRHRRHHHHRKHTVPTPRWMNATTSQGVSRPQEELDYLPFETLTLVAGEGGVVVGASGNLTARPQRPFRGERLIITSRNDDGDFGNGVVIDPAIYVGAVQVGASQGGGPVAAFAATAFGVRLSMPAAGQGTDIKIYIRAIATSDSNIVLTAILFGRAMR